MSPDTVNAFYALLGITIGMVLTRFLDWAVPQILKLDDEQPKRDTELLNGGIHPNCVCPICEACRSDETIMIRKFG